MDSGPPSRNVRVMDDGLVRFPDEVHSARAAGSFLLGDLESAEAELGQVRARKMVRFLGLLAVLTPTVSIRLAWRVGARWGWHRPPGAR